MLSSRAIAGAGMALVVCACSGNTNSTNPVLPNSPSGSASKAEAPTVSSDILNPIPANAGPTVKVTSYQYGDSFADLTIASDGSIWGSTGFETGNGQSEGAVARIVDMQLVNTIASGRVDDSELSIAPSTNNRVWVFDQNFSGNGIFYADPSATTLQPPNGLAAGPYASPFVEQMVQGPDGNVWFTATAFPNNTAQAWFGYVDKNATSSSGVHTFFPPNLSTTTTGALETITFGPDGDVWLGALLSNGTWGFYRYTASGTLVGLIPVSGVDVIQSAVLGPDNNIWFVDDGLAGSNEIGRVTMSGNVTLFPVNPDVNGANRFLSGTIAVGPDGALWFGESNLGATNPAIGRITTGGTIAQYPAPSDWPNGIEAVVAPPPGCGGPFLVNPARGSFGILTIASK